MRGKTIFASLVTLTFLCGFVFAPFAPAEDKPADKDKPAEKAEKKAEKKPDAPLVAHIRLSGDLDESPVPADGLFGPPPENLKSKLDRIRKAAKDEKVKGVYLEIGDIHLGFGKLNELRKAVAEVRAAGKKVFAYTEDPATKQFLLGLSADVFAIPEAATVNLVGLRAEVTFFKDTLALLRLEVDMLRMGEFKGAVEPFVRDSLSKENREQIEAMLNDNFDNEIVAAMIAARPERKWSAKQLGDLIDAGPFTAKKALALGLVDRVAYPDKFEAGFAKDLGLDEVNVRLPASLAGRGDVPFVVSVRGAQANVVRMTFR